MIERTVARKMIAPLKSWQTEKIERGIADVRAGCVHPAKEVYAEIEAKLALIRAKKKPKPVNEQGRPKKSARPPNSTRIARK